MSTKKLSVNKACVFLGLTLLIGLSVTIIIIYKLTGNISAVLCCLLFCVFVLFCVICFVALVRCKLTLFSDLFCRTIANLKMINSTLMDQEVPPHKQNEFLSASASQLDKLDFLMQAMIKTSRLETGVISLDKKKQTVYDTLASALGGILLNAEKKQIDVSVNCPEHLAVPHGRKWTSEALFNILDNAVKYTPEKGQIAVSVECWELYLKISIADTGKGIPEKHQGAIFKRFYREDDVHEVEGIGIGLYLAREIITMQGGYIKLTSSLGSGSCFMVFLPCD